MTRQCSAPDTEPEESNFQLPSEDVEHLFQVVDYWQDEKDASIVVARIEVVGGDENGRSLLHRVNCNDKDKGFYYTRLFLKAIGQPYKGQFTIQEDNWPGSQFYASVKHNPGKNNKTYANLDQYNFAKSVDNTVRAAQAKAPADPDAVGWDD